MKCYKTELDLNNRQRAACLQHAGAARWAYNWGLRRKIEAYKSTGKSPTAIDLHRELVVLKHSTVPWLSGVSKCAPQAALRNLDVAFKNFFRRCKTGAKRKGYPHFKSRKNGIGSFTLEGAVHVIDGGAIQLPRIGVVRLKERGYVPSSAVVKSVTISERAGHWFVSATTDETPKRILGSEILGVDVGVKSLAVLSDGTVFENPRALRSSEQRLRRLQKSVSRKVNGSCNRRKAAARLARQHYRVSCARNEAIHQATNAIAKRAAVVGIESLNVAGMAKNHCLAKAISDAGMAEFHRQLRYKMMWSGGLVVSADQWYPSSKICSGCGAVKESLPLSERIFCCECGLQIDRDLNAAINLRNMAASSAVAARGEESAGRLHKPTKLPSVKRELNAIESVSG